MRAVIDAQFDTLTDSLHILDGAKIRLWGRGLTVQRSSYVATAHYGTLPRTSAAICDAVRDGSYGIEREEYGMQEGEARVPLLVAFAFVTGAAIHYFHRVCYESKMRIFVRFSRSRCISRLPSYTVLTVT
jgi:hypothetical protein